MNDERKTIRIAVVGSGPAGFYAAGHLLAEGPAQLSVDMFERLPTPWGLVRFGVAPDHPKIKTVTRVYEKTAEHPRFRFFGNVEIGRDLSVAELQASYHAVIFAVGTPGDRALGIPGEDLPGSLAATDFVAWYNAHPDYERLEVDLSVERAVVVGNGNVALDVARILVTPVEALARTDIADHALAALRASRLREVVVIGRRGPAQAAFTNPELKELGEIEGVSVVVDRAELEEALAQTPGEPAGTAKRNVEILRSYADRQPNPADKRIVFAFLRSPIELRGRGRVEEAVLVRNRLVQTDSQLKAAPTDQIETLATGLVVRAIGYRGSPIAGLPFDERAGVIPNAAGRVLDPATGTTHPGLYVVGWIKRGPTGVIGTNKKDAQETVDALLEDIAAGRLPQPSADGQAVAQLLAQRNVQVVSYAGWQAIDRFEQERGKPEGRPRNKLANLEQLLAVAASGERERETVAASSERR